MLCYVLVVSSHVLCIFKDKIKRYGVSFTSVFALPINCVKKLAILLVLVQIKKGSSIIIRFRIFDVSVHKERNGFLTSVYRKPRFSEKYFRLNSFSPKDRETGLIKIYLQKHEKTAIV